MWNRRNLIIAASAFSLGLLAALLYLREPTVPLNKKSLVQARARWQNASIRSYDARYKMHGTLYEVRVRNGLVEDIMVNGRTPSIAQVGAYSMEGLFETLETELENITDEAGPFGANVVARVHFHDRLGYPQRYIRSGSGLSRGSSLEMLDFKPLAE